MDADITRCRGEGSHGRICPKRSTCQRHLAIAEDAADSSRLKWSRLADWLCRVPGYPYYWEEGKP